MSNGIELKLDSFLKSKLDECLRLQRRNWDVFPVIDGKEGSGKSTLGFQIATYLSDGKFSYRHIIEGGRDVKEKLQSAPDKGVYLIDEGSLIFSSKDTMATRQKQLLKILNVIRQKRMILIIVCPSFFELTRYIAVHRTRFLIHTYTSTDYIRGRFAYFNERAKPILYAEGKKRYNTYRKPQATFIGRFTDYIPEWNEEYLKLKRRSLMEALADPKDLAAAPEVKKAVCVELVQNFRKSCPEVEVKTLARGFNVSERTILRYSKEKEEMTRV